LLFAAFSGERDNIMDESLKRVFAFIPLENTPWFATGLYHILRIPLKILSLTGRTRGLIPRVSSLTGFIRSCLASAVFFSTVLCAQETITYRTGQIKIIRPDGEVLIVGKNEAAPDIPSGSGVEVLSGTIKIKPNKGFVQLVVGDSVATVGTGDEVLASINAESNIADFRIDSGEAPVIIGNTTVIVKSGQEVLSSLDKRSGLVKVKSIRGVIDTISAGVRAKILEGGLAMISTDAKTADVHIEAGVGKIQVTSAEGEVVTLAMKESMDVAGSPEGVISSFPEDVSLPFLPEEPSGQ